MTDQPAPLENPEENPVLEEATAPLEETRTPAGEGDSSPEVAPTPEETAAPTPDAAENVFIGEQEEIDEELSHEERRRKRLLVLLLLLLLLLCCIGGLFIRYLLRPQPLPELLPLPVNLTYPPHYLFSIYGVDKPVGVAVSPDGERIYVAETGGERLVKIFDREGAPLGSIAPPRTTPGERSPVYTTTDSRGRVYVTDRLQHAIYVYARDGVYLDTILDPDLTLSEYVSKHTGGNLASTASFAFNIYQSDVFYTLPGQAEQTLPRPDPYAWDPLGVRLDNDGRLLLTDVLKDNNLVRLLSGNEFSRDAWQEFAPQMSTFGATGMERGQLLYPNVAVTDSQGRIFVTDGNNGRISVWDAQGGGDKEHRFLFEFGKGTGDGALSLPRGAMIDSRDRLFVVDAVGQNVKVYDVSGAEPVFLYAFGDFGIEDGLFNYPNDIAIDATGRLYIADRENNRIQVWSY